MWQKTQRFLDLCVSSIPASTISRCVQLNRPRLHSESVNCEKIETIEKSWYVSYRTHRSLTSEGRITRHLFLLLILSHHFLWLGNAANINFIWVMRRVSISSGWEQLCVRASSGGVVYSALTFTSLCVPASRLHPSPSTHISLLLCNYPALYFVLSLPKRKGWSICWRNWFLGWKKKRNFFHSHIVSRNHRKCCVRSVRPAGCVSRACWTLAVASVTVRTALRSWPPPVFLSIRPPPSRQRGAGESQDAAPACACVQDTAVQEATL